MAEIVTRENVCDICGESGEIEIVTISVRGKTYVVEACEKDALTALEYATKGSTGPRRVKGSEPPRKPQGHSVTPIA